MIMIAGPCTVESIKDTYDIAQGISNLSKNIGLRGGCWKPRTDPESFLGLGEDGVEILIAAKRKYGINHCVIEALNVKHLEYLDQYRDEVTIQIGARNMQNFDLLQELNNFKYQTILLKRGFGNTVYETCKAREYIKKDNVILCERGVRTFSDSSRFTLDLAAVPALQLSSGCPVIVDPSHAAGDRNLVLPLARAALAVGADGLMIEVTSSLSMERKCDEHQAITVKELETLLSEYIKY
jgi:3-deoxy-7-phosphoheptulonate synthase